MTTYREERIRRLAHEIWEREGHPHGRDAEHWRMATEAYEAELAGSRFDDAGQPIGVGHQASQERTMAAPKARRGGKPQADIAPSAVETAPATKRKRRTKAEMAAAAAGVAGAAAAVAATVAVTKRRRGAKAEMADEAVPAPAARAAPRRARKAISKTTLSAAEPAPATVASDAATGAVLDPSAAGPSGVATGPFPDSGAEPPSDAVLETPLESAPEADPSGERVAD